jgi:hypothetical protein
MDNKDAMNRVLRLAGIPTALFMDWQPNRGLLIPGRNPRLKNAFGTYQDSFIVKPISSRASRHVTPVDDVAGLAAAADEIYGTLRATSPI